MLVGGRCFFRNDCCLTVCILVSWLRLLNVVKYRHNTYVDAAILVRSIDRLVPTVVGGQGIVLYL